MEEKLIKEYFLKDELIVNNIIDDYYNYILTIIRNFHNIGPEDTEEIISDVFFIVWKNRNNLDKNSKLSPYIAGITRRIIFRRYKENKLDFLENEDLEKNFINDTDLEKSLEEKEMNDCIINNLKSLGETEYKVFTKFYFEDKKIKDIAKECGISTNNAKVTLHRTRKKVREFLKIGGFY